MVRHKIYDAAGPTPSFVGNTTAPEIDTMTERRIVETSTFLDGRFEGDTLRVEFIGRFDFDRRVAKVDEIRVFVDGERHHWIEYDRPLDLYRMDLSSAQAAAAKSGVHVTGNLHANRYSGDMGDDRFIGGGGDDRLAGASGDDVLRGGSGDDRLTDDSGDDVLRGGGGNDRLFDKSGDDHLSGGGGDDRLKDGSGDDVLHGGGGADRLHGGFGEDRLVGGSGDDRLGGGFARDVLTGGGGADVFVFNYRMNDTARDRVTDFQPGRDLIDLAGIDAQVFLQGEQSFQFIGEEEFSGTAGELRFDGHRLLANVYGVDALPYIVIKINGIETLSEADLLL